MPATWERRYLKNGGNAIDAAVAIGYALAVVYPSAGNIGGGGLATIHLANGKDTFINFREKAPAAASANMYLDAKGNIVPMASLYGYKAIAVPGTVMGFEKMLTEYGTMTRAQVMAPAIKLAEQGYILQAGDLAFFEANADYFRKEPNVGAIFLKNGKPYAAGDTVGAEGSGRHLEGDFGQGPRRLLQGRHREPGGGGVEGARRASHHEGFHVVHRRGNAAADLRLSRLSHCFLAAAIVGRGFDVRDRQHPLRLSDGQDGASFGPRAFISWPRPCAMPSWTAITGWAIRPL